MRARGDMAGVAGTVLGIALLAAGAPLLVPTWVLQEEPEAAPRPAPPETARELEARYQRALAEERVKWEGLPPEEQARQHDAFKARFFQREAPR